MQPFLKHTSLSASIEEADSTQQADNVLNTAMLASDESLLLPTIDTENSNTKAQLQTSKHYKRTKQMREWYNLNATAKKVYERE